MRINIFGKFLAPLEGWMPYNVNQQPRLILVRRYCFFRHVAQSKIRGLETNAAFRMQSMGTYSEHNMTIGFGVARKIFHVARRVHATAIKSSELS